MKENDPLIDDASALVPHCFSKTSYRCFICGSVINEHYSKHVQSESHQQNATLRASRFAILEQLCHRTELFTCRTYQLVSDSDVPKEENSASNDDIKHHLQESQDLLKHEVMHYAELRQHLLQLIDSKIKMLGPRIHNALASSNDVLNPFINHFKKQQP